MTTNPIARMKHQAILMEKAERIGKKVALGQISEVRAKAKLHRLTLRAATIYTKYSKWQITEELYETNAKYLAEHYLKGLERHQEEYAKRIVERSLRRNQDKV